MHAAPLAILAVQHRLAGLRHLVVRTPVNPCAVFAALAPRVRRHLLVKRSVRPVRIAERAGHVGERCAALGAGRVEPLIENVEVRRRGSESVPSSVPIADRGRMDQQRGEIMASPTAERSWRRTVSRKLKRLPFSPASGFQRHTGPSVRR